MEKEKVKNTLTWDGGYPCCESVKAAVRDAVCRLLQCQRIGDDRPEPKPARGVPTRREKSHHFGGRGETPRLDRFSTAGWISGGSPSL